MAVLLVFITANKYTDDKDYKQVIFDLKNNHGWKDQQDLNHSGTVSVQFSTVYEQRP